ncbi:hypothetical protein B0J11DRAFT_597629 [Dendryphion nanum]|uniref:Fe2OG dioxygenase domain-containing protein n=1 Tax=Dendryphion nanum TaxID=256645 RepID=A0A9P9IAH2_9PLEO|nr:hypothetical protein B0J11DRAFT_597629 [Dendryphion nanum]
MPHSDHSSTPPPSFNNIPPFPETVLTAPLLRISLQKLLAHDVDEEEKCWKACCELGFFYLDLSLSSTESSEQSNGFPGESLFRHADSLFDVMKGFFDLSVDEKAKYDFADQGSYFGYKGYGAGIVDKEGTKDRNEFYNISKDDILGLSPRLPSPDILNTHRDLYANYIRDAHSICALLATLISTRLPLNPSARQSGGLPALHRLTTSSGDQIRFVKAPPQEQSTQGVALGEHTDFGSITILFNRLGGLQVRLPDSISAVPPASSTPCSPTETRLCENGWTYVRPLPNHCIVNLGDAMVKFSAGMLRSNVHRVVAPPGEQGVCTRYSLVYFCRPEDEVRLGRIVVGGEGEEGEEMATAKEWILRRALGRRKGGNGGWEGSKGTEEGA